MTKTDEELRMQYGLIVHDNNNAVLRNNAICGNVEDVIWLLEHGANVHASNDEALRVSARCGYSDVIKILIAYGAKVHAADDEALRECVHIYMCYAIKENYEHQGCLRTIKLLLKHGANIHSNNNEILKRMQQHFDEELANIIFDYCCNDNDHQFFPKNYIQSKHFPTKSARKIN